jgi:two-component system, OmpR family, phosphate regulon sensor histidine kinase PhoR
MKRRGLSILARLFLAYAAVVLATALAGVLISSQVIRRDAWREVEQNLAGKAVLFREIARPILHSEAAPGLEERIRQIGNESGIRLTIIGADGKVLADSQEDPAQMANHATRPEVVAARMDGHGTAMRYSATLRTPMAYYALAVVEDGKLLGFARTAVPNVLTGQRLRRLSELVTIGSLLAVLLILIPSYWFALDLSRRIGVLKAGTQAIAGGDLRRRLALSGVHELEELADSVNQLAQSLVRQIEVAQGESAKFEAILSGMVEGVIAVDSSERLLHINSAAAGLFGVAVDDVLGRKVWEILRVPALLEALQAALRGQGGSTSEVRVMEGGEEKVIATICGPLMDAGGMVAGAVAVLHDVTRLRQLENLRRDFVANASHELKTPLTAIQGLTETLLDDKEMALETRERFLAKLRDQSRRLEALVNDMLSISRAESREDEFERLPVDLREVAQESGRALLPAAEAKRLKLELSLPDGQLIVLGDRKALDQAVDNLLDNAIKYTPEDRCIKLELSAAGKLARIEVRDTGIGIAPEHLERIFERFYRVDKGRSRELGGTGLGLAIVKHVALGHGGQVSVESRLGQGSSFVLEIPLRG